MKSPTITNPFFYHTRLIHIFKKAADVALSHSPAPAYLAALVAGILMCFVRPAAADSLMLEKPMAAGSVHEGGVDMAIYYLERGDQFEVVATYAWHDGPYEPMRLRMGLSDGDDVSFGLPEMGGTQYRFTRVGAVVLVEATPPITSQTLVRNRSLHATH